MQTRHIVQAGLLHFSLPWLEFKIFSLKLMPQFEVTAVWIRSVLSLPTARVLTSSRRILTVFQSHWTSLLNPMSWIYDFIFACRQKIHKYVGLCSNCQEEKNDTARRFVAGHHLSEKQWNEKHPRLFMTAKCHSYRAGIEYSRDYCFY